MKQIFTPLLRRFICSAVLLLSFVSSYASHIVGANLTYTYVSGYTYKMVMSIYADCGPASLAAFETLPISTPQVCIFNGSTLFSTVSLTIDTPICGVEVTPGLPAGVSSQCTSTSSTMPGVKKFVYSGNVTLSGPSAVWRFVYTSNNGSTVAAYGCGHAGSGAPSGAGRAAAITNIAGGTLIQLIDTLNNSVSPNSSSYIVTTTPTYFVLNEPNGYNPASVDPDGDNLVFSLVSATNGTGACGAVGGPVSYVGTAWPGTPVSATTPLTVVADSFNFDSSNGVLSFHPNVLQRSVVVYNIREYRAGVFVGSSQYEMTVLVLTSPPCTGTPVAGGVNPSTLSACGTTSVTLTDTGSSSCNAYQWQSSADSVSWGNIAGAVSLGYTFTGLSANTYYRCIVSCTSSGASDTTAGVKIVYTSSCPCVLFSPGTVTSSVASACPTTSVTLNNSTYSVSSVTMQWQLSPDSTTWTNIAGATIATYSFTGLTVTMWYRLKFICTSGADSIVSPGYKITYTTSCVCTGTPVAGTATASALSSCSSCSLTLNLIGAGVADSLSYQWQSSNTGTLAWSNISGATTVPYTFMPTGAKYYRCAVTCMATGAIAYSSSVFVGYQYSIIADSVSSSDSSCAVTGFYVRANGTGSTLLRLKTYYGDGTTDSIPLTNLLTTSYANPTHTYGFAGYYTVKQVLYYNNVPQDSIVIYYNEVLNCHVLPLKLYYDTNGDCIKEFSEPYNSYPLLIKIDSNGVPVDTLSATSGLYYHALGPVGTVYSFGIISAGVYASCPSSGILYDTIISAPGTYPVKYFGLNCTGSTAFDLAVNSSLRCGTWHALGNILITNSYCTPENATVTMNFSPKYTFHSAIPTPLSVVGNTITWNLNGVAVDSPVHNIIVRLWHLTFPLLTVGDTIQSQYMVTPVTGDVNPANNNCSTVDTVKIAFDPNEMSVAPSGCIPSDSTTQLQYTINFENTGNDTAHNISVMDTLSANVDPKSLRIVAASATMNIALLNDGTYNIVKFDFPQINLLDSSHFGQCDGMVIFNINTLAGLANGSTIFNHAGIFFDDNPVVMTDTVENIVGCVGTAVHSVHPVGGSVQVFPNPANDELMIKMDAGAYTSFTITNSIGQEMMQQSLTTTQTKVNVGALPAGLYYITFRGSNGTKVQKFVKM